MTLANTKYCIKGHIVTLSNSSVIVKMIRPTLDLQVDRLPHGAPSLHTPGRQNVNDLNSVVRKIQKHPVVVRLVKL